MPQPRIHKTAIIADSARLAADVTIGAYAIIEDHVEIGQGSIIESHSVIRSFVRMGSANHIHPHAVIGGTAQDVSFDGSETWVEIGDHNIIREGVTIHRSTKTSLPTRIGSHCFLMANTHVAHDCCVEDQVIMVNGVNLGGHVEVGYKALLGGMSQVHQFSRIGSYAMVASLCMVRKDVLPFCMLGSEPARHYRLNTIGLRRAGITGERYKALETAYRRLRQGNRILTDLPQTEEIIKLTNWLAAESRRGLSGFAKPSSTGAEVDSG